MIRRWKAWALLVGVIAALGVSGGLSAAQAKPVGAKAKSDNVTLVWWHNATVGPQKAFWQKVADDFHKSHPDVTVKPVPIQNEQFNTKIPVALQSGDPPDIYQQWGGGQLATQVKAGKVGNIDKLVKPWIKSIGGAAAGWQYGGKQYGIPYNLGVVGFWYNKALFKQAGISAPPDTWTDFFADIKKLKAAGITPISIGGKDRWPDA